MLFSRHTTTTAAAASALFAAKFFLIATPPPVKSDAVVNDVDAGILALSPSSAASSAAGSSVSVIQSDALCTHDYVDCLDGYTNDGTTCATACFDSASSTQKCCKGERACYRFTGRICKDGSCSGFYACAYAKITIVVNSCIGGTACWKVGYNRYGATNNVGNFINSCTATISCAYVAFGNGGGVGSLEGSCTANFACEFLGAGVAAGNSGQGRGPVTSNLKDCCTYELACRQFNEAEIPSQCKVTSSPTQMPTPMPTPVPTPMPTPMPTTPALNSKSKKKTKQTLTTANLFQ
ncbi:hypothetical protein ACHAWU_006254 [Discostella pseudostelligera]|uniref:Uncharacterized protein n=1 Tax=Discostella pseudostelligera TaxID=259834 RepID=A0ABD3MK09_9STRA